MINTTSLKSRQAAAVAPGVATKNIYATRARNAEIWDVDDRRFIDFTAGISVNNTGHCHPEVMAAVARQATAFAHTCFHIAPYESYIRLAERLNAMVNTGSENRTMLSTTGSEAVENAIKIARAYTDRPAVVAFSGAFHGRTLMGMALTCKVTPYKKNFGPFPPEIYRAPFPHAYHGISVEQALSGLEALFSEQVEPQQVAAIIVEPVQGEGGFNVAPPEYMRALREIADRYGILLVSDEVQAGLARTGKMLSIEHSGVTPDIVTLGKALGGGFPLSAVVGRREVMAAAQPGGLGGTYAGNPVAIAAAHSVLDVIESEALYARATEIGEHIKARLHALANRPDMKVIGDIRGQGAMVAFELVNNRQSKQPATALTEALVREAEQRGLIIMAWGTPANGVRLLVPLTIPHDVLDEGLDIIEQSLEVALASETDITEDAAKQSRRASPVT